MLLIGVGYDRLSARHYADTMLAKKTVEIEASVLENGQAVWKRFSDTDFDSDRFPVVGAALETQTDLVEIGLVGQAECRLFPMREATAFALFHPEFL